MDATRIIAIRHGETAWNVDSRLQGHLDIPLNDVGLWQARQAALALADEPIDAIYSSDLQRAWVTAQAIAETTQAPLAAHQGLRERSFGVLQGHTFEELEAKEPEQAYRWRKRDPAFAPEGVFNHHHAWQRVVLVPAATRGIQLFQVTDVKQPVLVGRQ